MKPAGALRPKNILAVQRGLSPLKKRDRLTCEEPLEIRLITGPQGQSSQRSLVLTMRTPGQDYELAAGLLFAEGLIQDRHQIVKMTYCVGSDPEAQNYNLLQVRLHPDLELPSSQLERFSLANASCGLCGKVQIEQLQSELFPDFGPDGPLLEAETIFPLQAAMREQQTLFARTGGAHAAALFDPSNFTCLRLCEDVGRHNALDKLIGSFLLEGQVPLLNKILLVSGRASYELIQKSLQASIPVVVAVGAPSSLAVELAQTYGQTLIGFLKPDRFNVYSGFQRLQTSTDPTGA